jgi:DNA polymerase III delta prime subunit
MDEQYQTDVKWEKWFEQVFAPIKLKQNDQLAIIDIFDQLYIFQPIDINQDNLDLTDFMELLQKKQIPKRLINILIKEIQTIFLNLLPMEPPIDIQPLPMEPLIDIQPLPMEPLIDIQPLPMEPPIDIQPLPMEPPIDIQPLPMEPPIDIQPLPMEPPIDENSDNNSSIDDDVSIYSDLSIDDDVSIGEIDELSIKDMPFQEVVGDIDKQAIIQRDLQILRNRLQNEPYFPNTIEFCEQICASDSPELYIYGPPGIGKTSIECCLIVKYLSQYQIPFNHILSLSALNDKEYLEDKRTNLPDFHRRNIYHLGNLRNKENFVYLLNQRNVVFIIDEAHIGNKKEQTLDTLLNYLGYKDCHNLLEWNIKLIYITATPGRLAFEAQRKGFITNTNIQTSQTFIIPTLPNYLSFQQLLDDNKILSIQLHQLNENNIEKMKTLLRNYLHTPKYHIFRLSSKREKERQLLQSIATELQWNIIELNHAKKSKHNVKFDTQPQTNTICIIINYYRASKRIPFYHLGLCYDANVTDSAAIVQSLVARCCKVTNDYDPIKYPFIHICNLPTIQEYIALYNARYQFTKEMKYHDSSISIDHGKYNPFGEIINQIENQLNVEQKIDTPTNLFQQKKKRKRKILQVTDLSTQPIKQMKIKNAKKSIPIIHLIETNNSYIKRILPIIYIHDTNETIIRPDEWGQLSRQQKGNIIQLIIQTYDQQLAKQINQYIQQSNKLITLDGGIAQNFQQRLKVISDYQRKDIWRKCTDKNMHQQYVTEKFSQIGNGRQIFATANNQKNYALYSKYGTYFGCYVNIYDKMIALVIIPPITHEALSQEIPVQEVQDQEIPLQDVPIS